MINEDTIVPIFLNYKRVPNVIPNAYLPGKA